MHTRSAAFYAVIIVVFNLICCSAQQNITGALIDAKSKNKDIDYLLFKAEAFYDAKAFANALTYAQKAHILDPNNERAALLLGYVHFSLAQLDMFQVAQKLLSQNSSSASSTDEFTKLNTLIGVSAAELAAFVVPDNRIITASGYTAEGAPTSGLFVNYPIFIPKSAPKARADYRGTIYHLNQAVAALCSIVDDSVKLTTGTMLEPRHMGKNCVSSPYRKTQTGKSHFLWALAHLTEAVAFHAIVLYTPTGSTQPNLVLRGQALGKSGTMAITDYLGGVADLAAILEVILPIDQNINDESMLTAMINDLQTTNLAFATLAGLPKEMTATVSQLMAKVTAQQNSLSTSAQTGTPTDTSSGSTATATAAQALKQILTTDLGKNIATQIAEKSAAGELTAEQQQQACSAYGAISSTPLSICASP